MPNKSIINHIVLIFFMKTNLKTILNKKLNDQGFTQSSISKKTGLSKSLIHKTLTITDNPGIYTISKIAKALNCSIDELLGNEQTKPHSYNYKIDNIILLKTVTEYINQKLLTKKIEFNIDIFFQCIFEIYKYSVERNENNKIDVNFAEWYIEYKLNTLGNNKIDII